VGDQETHSDFNRQKDNVEYASTYALPAVGYSPSVTVIADAVLGDQTNITPFNELEGNLTAIENCGIPLPTGWESGTMWVGGGAAPIYTDANRWEGNPEIAMETVERIQATKHWCGTFKCGQGVILP